MSLPLADHIVARAIERIHRLSQREAFYRAETWKITGVGVKCSARKLAFVARRLVALISAETLSPHCFAAQQRRPCASALGSLSYYGQPSLAKRSAPYSHSA